MTSNGDSPARGLKHVLSLKRQSRDETSSIDSDGKSPQRSSTDSLPTTKLKSVVSNLSNDDADLSDGRRSAKSLLGFGKLKDKVRRKSQIVEAPEDLRGRDAAPRPLTSNGQSNETIQSADDDDSGVMEFESEGDISLENSTLASDRPTLVNHDSHVGFLTSSSPQIKAIIIPPEEPATPTSVSSPAKLKKLLGKTLTMPGSRSPSVSPSRPVSRGGLSGSPSPALLPTTKGRGSSVDSRSPSPSSRKEQIRPVSTIAARRQSRGADTLNLPSLQIPPSLANKITPSVPSIVTVPDTPPMSSDPLIPSISLPDQATEEGSPRRPSSSKTLASHRRIRSDGLPSSKLSQSMAPPLTPLEEVRSPAHSRSVSGASTGGFFSSVFSAAQNAANTLTTTLQTSTKPKVIPAVKPQLGKAEESDPETETEQKTQEPARPLAIETLGSGDLSMQHLGIVPDKSPSPTPSIKQSISDVGRSRAGTVIHNEQASARAEGESAARAVSAAYSIDDEPRSAVTPSVEDVVTPRPRPASMIDILMPEDKGPASGNVLDDSGNLSRNDSIRSKLERRRRRHRNSSGATTGSANHNALSINNSNRFSGFTKANAKRNKDFHNFFRSVPDDDDLIEDYSCALQRDIILAGRIYISEGHVCFSSNILGWVTNLVISFEEIVSVEKESTAMLFANAIAIQTLHARHTFRSLLSRDATYDLIVNIWKLNHPGLESSENGVRLASGTGSKTQRIMDGSDRGSEGSINSEESVDDSGSQDSRSFVDSIQASVNGEELTSRKVSTVGNNTTLQTPGVSSANGTTSEKLASSVASLGEFPGPISHASTECNDSTTHLEKLLKDDVISAPLGKVYSLVFGPASTTFMPRWLQDECKVTDLQMEANKALSESHRSRSFTYIKPLTNPIGPRSTKCVITEHLDFLDLERSMTVSVTTQTPDVPSGNLFVTKTKYCFMWGPNNSTRIIMTYAIEWTGKSWLKGPIEKGATDGQTTYANDLVKALKNGTSLRGRNVTQGSKSKKLRKLKNETDTNKGAEKESSPWGPFQSLHDTITITIRRVRPLFSMYGVVGILVFLLVVSWFGDFRSRNTRSPIFDPRSGSSTGRLPYSARVAGWEEMWMTEEEALWQWLQDRTGLSDGLILPSRPSPELRDRDSTGSNKFTSWLRRKPSTGGDFEWAMKLTEDRLAALKKKASTLADQKRKPSRSSSKSKQETAQLSEQEAIDLESLLGKVLGSV